MIKLNRVRIEPRLGDYTSFSIYIEHNDLIHRVRLRIKPPISDAELTYRIKDLMYEVVCDLAFYDHGDYHVDHVDSYFKGVDAQLARDIQRGIRKELDK